MNFYDQELHYQIDKFKASIICLTSHKPTIDQFEKLVEVIKDNGIQCNHMITTHTDCVSLFLFHEVANENHIIKSLHITSSFLNSSIEAIEPVLDINHCSYGFVLKLDNENKFYISLNQVKKEFSPLDIERMLTEAKTIFAELWFIRPELLDLNNGMNKQQFEASFQGNFEVAP